MRSLEKGAIRLLQVILLFITGFLAYEGARYSYYSSKVYDQLIYLMEDSTGTHLVVFVLVSLILAGLYRLLSKIPDKQENISRIVLYFACVWIAVIGFFYIREHPYYPVGDQISTTAGAAYARTGNYVMFSKGGYIGIYEQQKGFLFLYEIFFTLFGDFCYDMTSRFHLGFYVITLLAGYSFLKIVAKKPFYRMVFCLLMMFCAPYMIYLPYVYGDLPSICFSMVLFWALAAYEQKGQKRYAAAAVAAGILALLVRTNIWIVLIAVGIGMLLMALRKRSIRPALAGICVILAAQGSVWGVNMLYEYRSGYESGVGMPRILHIAMGLQETDGAPGIYNRYNQSVFGDCDFDQEASANVAKAYIEERLQEMAKDPDYTWDFFLTKVKMQWLEPLFEGLYSTNSFSEEVEVPDWVIDLYYGDFHDTVWKMSNYYQSLVYLAGFVFVAVSLFVRKSSVLDSCAGWIPLIGVTGGFLFCIIWENQCRYMLPYYVYLLLYAAVGLGCAGEAANRLIDGFIIKLLPQWIKNMKKM